MYLTSFHCLHFILDEQRKCCLWLNHIIKQISFSVSSNVHELNSLLGSSHLVDYISVHIRFDLERYLLIIFYNLYFVHR